MKLELSPQREKIILFAGIGLVVAGMGLCVLFLGFLAPETGLFTKHDISGRIAKKLVSLGLITDPDEIEYLYTDAFLNIEEGVHVLTDTGIRSFSNKVRPALTRIDYSDIQSLNWDDAVREEKESQLVVKNFDGKSFEIDLPTKDGIHKKFIEVLSTRHRQAKMAWHAEAARISNLPEKRRVLRTLLLQPVAYSVFCTLQDTPLGFTRYSIREETGGDGKRVYHYREQFLYDLARSDRSTHIVAALDSYYDHADFKHQFSRLRAVDLFNHMSVEVILKSVRADTYELTAREAGIVDGVLSTPAETEREQMGLEDEYLYFQEEDFSFLTLFFTERLKKTGRLSTKKIILERDYPYYRDEGFMDRLISEKDGVFKIRRNRGALWTAEIEVDTTGNILSWANTELQFISAHVPADRVPENLIDRWEDASKKYFIREDPSN